MSSGSSLPSACCSRLARSCTGTERHEGALRSGLLRQMAVRSGASDYRTFPLEQPSLDEAARLAPTAMENIWVSSGENLAQLLEHVRAHGGVPPPAGSPGSRSSPLDAREAL